MSREALDAGPARPLALRPDVRRTFRFAGSSALALALGYGLGMPLPHLPAVIAAILNSTGAPPPNHKQLMGLIILVLLTLGLGVLLVPLLGNYPFPAILLITCGLFLGNRLALLKGQALIGTLLGIGLTVIPAVGTVYSGLAQMVIEAFTLSVIIAVVSIWLVYPWLPEDDEAQAAPAAPASEANWIALRAALVVVPSLLFALNDPLGYIPLIMKSLVLSQEGTALKARDAGREMIGAVMLGGLAAAGLWFLLGLWPVLAIYTLIILLFGLLIGGRLFGVMPSRLSPTFWQAAFVNTLILLGPAVEDSANGDDVYQAFATRLTLFFVVTAYAWAAIAIIERLRTRVTQSTSTRSE